MPTSAVDNFLYARKAAPLLESSAPDGGFDYGEDPRSLLTQVTGPIIGAVGAVGNLLDLPGSMVRDTLTGNNPFDQLLSPFSSQNRVDGRGMLTAWGLTSPNKETGISGWLDNPMEGVRDIGGFLAETALDPLNMLSRPAKAAGLLAGSADATRAGRGWIDNFFDPLRLSEAGEKLGVRSKLKRNADGMLVRDEGGEGLIRKGMDRASRMLTKTFDAVEKTPKVGNAFGAVREITNDTADSIRRAGKAVFDASVRGTYSKTIQPLMEKFSALRRVDEDSIKTEMLGVNRMIEMSMRATHGKDIMEKLRNNTAKIETSFVEAASIGDNLVTPIQEKLGQLGYGEDEISAISSELTEITRNPETLSQQSELLRDWLSGLETRHAERAAKNILDEELTKKFSELASKTGTPSKELKKAYDDLGWIDMGNGDLFNETLGLRVGRLSDKGNYRIFKDAGGTFEELPGNYKAKHKAVSIAHEHGRLSAKEAATSDFDDVYDDLLSSFSEHDESVKAALRDISNGDPARPTMFTLQDEIASAQHGISPAEYPYRLLNTQEMRDTAEMLRPDADLIQELQDMGLHTGRVNDPAGLEFGPRRQGDLAKAEFRKARGEGEGALTGGPEGVLGTPSTSTTSHRPEYLGFRHGRPGINHLYRNPEIAETIDSARRMSESGELAGKITEKQAEHILGTVSDFLDEADVRKFMDEVTDPNTGLIDIESLESSVKSLVEIPADGDKWVLGGQHRSQHVFENLLSFEGGDKMFSDMLVPKVKGVSNAIDVEKAKSLGIQQVASDKAYAAAIAEIEKRDGIPQMHKHAAKEQVKLAQQQSLPIFIKKSPSGDGFRIDGILIPRTEVGAHVRLKRQISNLKKKFDKSTQPDSDTLKSLQRDLLVRKIRTSYGDLIIDEMPQLDEYGMRKVKDYRDGLTGNDKALTDEEYSKLVEDEMITSDRSVAEAEGKVFELLDSRHEKLAELMLKPDGGYSAYRKHGLFTNDVTLDAIDYHISATNAKRKMDVFTEFVKSHIDDARHDGSKTYPDLLDPFAKTDEYTIESLLEYHKSSLNPEKYLKYLAKESNPRFKSIGEIKDPKLAKQLEKEFADEVKRIRQTKIKSADYAELAKGLNLSRESLVDLPGVGSVVKFVDAATRLFKVGVLAWPGRITRDFTSATARAIESGMLDLRDAGRAKNSVSMGMAVALGDRKKTEGFLELLNSPDFARDFNKSPHAKLVGTAERIEAGTKVAQSEAVYQYFQDRFFIEQGGAYSHTMMDMNVPMFDANKAGTLDPIRESIPNQAGTPLKERVSGTLKDIKSDGLSSLNPANLGGIPHTFT